jgi:Concanavalin A-like lectin/glucanases superfamily
VIHLPDDPRLDVTSFTLEAFVRFEQVPRPGQPVGLLDNDAQYGLLLRPAPNCPDDGQRYLACDVGGDSLCLPLSPLAGSSESLASFATRWHHLACTYEGDVSTLSIYFDGAFAGSRATRVVNTSATNGLTIGQDGDLVAGAILDPLVGDLDELRLWRTVRTAEQLRAAAARGE